MSEYVIAAGVWHHAPACIFLRIDSIQTYGLIPYRNKLRITYTPLASYIASQLYSALPSDIVLRTVIGKYNITEAEGFNITFALQKYHSNKVGISLNILASIMSNKIRFRMVRILKDSFGNSIEYVTY